MRHAGLAAMVFRHRAGLLCAFVFACALFPLVSQSTTKTDRESDGAGAIVFDTARLPELTGEDAVSLFDFDLGDKRVEFLAQGYWQSTIASTSTFSFGFGSSPGFSWGTPVFAQKVDLSLWFMLDRHWYFETDFADEFTKNTVAAGYVGDGILKSARIANRGIVFPSFYSIDEVNRGIGGGDNQAPGLSLHVAGEKWQSHAAVRYDMLKAEEKTWYGKNAVSTDTIALSGYLTGSRYVLPTAAAVSAVTAVYVENAGGSFRDAAGRRYKKLDESQYLLNPAAYTVLLAKDAGAARVNGVLPAVAFGFGGMTADSVALAAQAVLVADAEIGVAAWFQSDENPELSDVTPFFFDVRAQKTTADAAGAQFVSAIDGERVLFVQHPAGFSPFTVAYRYDAGLTTATDVAVASQQTETTATSFAAVIGEDDLSFVSEDFFYLTHTYADIYCTDEAATDPRSARVRFPFAHTDAGIYLGYGQKSDLELNVRTYTAVSRFDIGTDAVPGTVRVYKNGVLDSGATYDSESGAITLSTAVAASDHIYVTWYEDSEDAESGAITAAAGFEYRPTDHLSGDISLATRWTFAVGKDFADADYTSPGFATLASRVRYETENLTLSNTVSASLESENTTGAYRILGMDERASDTVYLAKNAAVNLPAGFVPVLNARAHGDEMPVLDADKNGSRSASDGARNDGISGYAVSVHWDFSGTAGATQTHPAWAATAIALPGVAGSLASASVFSFALKNPDPAASDVSVYLQLGVQADDVFLVENATAIPTWLVSKASKTDENPTDVRSAFVPSDYPTENSANGWQTVTVVLTEQDRSRLAYYHDARLVICSSSGGMGEFLVGPYQADGVSFSVTHPAETQVSSYQTTSTTLSASKVKDFNTGTNYVQTFDWYTYDAPLASAEKPTIVAQHYFSEVDMQQYETLSLWFRYNPQERIAGSFVSADDTALRITLDRPNDASSPAVLVSLDKQMLETYRQHAAETESASDWHELTVDLLTKSVKIDGNTVSTAQVNRSVVPVRLCLALATADEAGYYARGSFSVDELSLFGARPYVVLQDKARAAWKKDGTVWEKNGYALVRDVSLAATGTGSRTVQTGGAGKDDGVLSSTAQAAFTLFDVRFSGDAAFSSAAEQPLAAAAHAVQTETPLFGVLSLSESYSYQPEESALEKRNALRTDFSALGVPVTLSAQTDAQANTFALTQKAVVQAETAIGAVRWNAEARAGQKLLPAARDDLVRTDSYGQGWLSATQFAFDAGDADASRRSVGAETTLSVQTPWLMLKPTLSAQTGGAYVSSSAQSFSDDSAFSLALPFSVGKQRFSVRWKKAGGGVSAVQKGGGYARDMGDLRTAYDDSRWFFTAFPLYDLISADLAADVLAHSAASAGTASATTESRYYAGLYEATWKRGFYGNTYDLLLPANASLSFSRDIRTAASTADVYQLKASVGYTALNVFGIAGSIPVATWFNQDEYAASLSCALKIPRGNPGAVSLLVTGYAQANFLVSATNSFRTGVEGSVEDADNWSGKITAIWKRLSARSPVVSVITLFKPTYDVASAKLTRTDSLNLGASCTKSSTATDATQKINAEYTHALDIALTKYITLNTLLGASYACTWDSIATIGATMSIGGTIRF